MTAAAALARLRDLGVTAEARGDGLALRPVSVIPPDLLAELRAHKAEVLALLAATTVPPASPEQAADKVADREAIAEPPLPAVRRTAEPLPEQVDALAQAMAALMIASPVYAGTTPDAALRYCQVQARRRLALLADPVARGLLVAAALRGSLS